jgi:curved DNA-binding protein CbpA
MNPVASPTPTPPESDSVRAWLEVLEELTYYELFGIPASANADDIQAAFHVFCDTFHPDRHLDRPREEREAVSFIFKRGTEAYLVLCDVGFRERYDAQISAARPNAQRLTFSPHSRPPPGPSRQTDGPPRLEDAARSPSARPFARRADELIKTGDLRQARIQLVMATYKDPSNDDLEAALKGLDAKLAQVEEARWKVVEK